MLADAATTGMLQRLSEHGVWNIEGKYAGGQSAQEKSLNTGAQNGRFERELGNGREAMPEMSTGQYEVLFDSAEDSSDSEEEDLGTAESFIVG